jgi:hypothetical protein
MANLKPFYIITLILVSLFIGLLILSFLNIDPMASYSWWQLTSPLWAPPLIIVWFMITAMILESFRNFFKS